MMRTCVYLALCLAFALVAASPTIAMERVLVVSDRWMPFNGEPGSPKEGYAVEMLRMIFKRKGIEVEYIERPWKRALEDVRAGRADMVIGANKKEAVDFIYPRSSLGKDDACFYTSKPDWKFTGPDSLAEVKTGYIEGYAYPEWYHENVKKHPDRHHALHGEDALPRMVQMLTEGRVQAIVGVGAVLRYYVAQTGQEETLFYAGCGPREEAEDLYFALSPANPSRSRLLADTIDEGMKTLRNTGLLNHLLIKYGLKDWAGKP